MKANKAADDAGALRHSLEVMLEALFTLVSDGAVDWRGAGNVEVNQSGLYASRRTGAYFSFYTKRCMSHWLQKFTKPFNCLFPHFILVQRNAIPVRVKATVREGHGKLLLPNINVFQARLRFIIKFSHEKSMSHNWPPETMM